jgi:hypothetical protein
MWEYLSRYKGYDIWRSKDGCGLRCYARSYPNSGGTVEPSGILRAYTLKAIRSIIDEDVKADEAIETGSR